MPGSLIMYGGGSGGTSGVDGVDGQDGASAYEIALANGFVGTETEWLDSLVGKDGADGANGSDAVFPAGFLAFWYLTLAPSGWFLFNDDTAFDLAANPVLAATFPSGRFTDVVDIRGEFLRLNDNGRGVDAGRVLLTSQADEFKSHEHKFEIAVQSSVRNQDGSGGVFSTAGDADNPDDYSNVRTNNTGLSGGSETRPRNVSFNLIIKGG